MAEGLGRTMSERENESKLDPTGLIRLLGFR